MGMYYQTETGFGFELLDKSTYNQAFVMHHYLGFSEDDDPDEVCAAFNKAHPGLRLLHYGNAWSGQMYWAVLAFSTYQMLASGNQPNAAQPSPSELSALNSFKTNNPHLVASSNPAWLVMQSVL